MGLSAIDQEQANVKRLSREIAALPPLPPIHVSHKGIYEAVDTIEVSTSERTHHFSPALPFPQSDYEHFGLTLAYLQQRFDELSLRSTEIFNREVEQNQAHLDVLQANYQKALDEETIEKSKERYWNTLGTVFQYVTSVASLLLAAKGYVSGEEDLASVAFLLAAGGFGLGNQLMEDTQSWKALIGYFTESLETRQTTESYLQTMTFVLSVSLSLGSLSSAQSKLFQTDDFSRLISLFKAALGASTKLGAAATQKRASDIQAALIRLQADQTDVLKDLELDASRNQEMLRGLQKVLSVMKRAIEDLSIHE